MKKKNQKAPSAQEEYVRGLMNAAEIVSKESGIRRRTEDHFGMYALNTAWHAIWKLIDAPHAPATPEQKKP